MALAIITGSIWANASDTAVAAPLSGRDIFVRCTPLHLDEGAALVDSISTKAFPVGLDGTFTLNLWPGAWRIAMPDGEVIDGPDHNGVVLSDGGAYDLVALRGYVAPPGVSTTLIEVPTNLAQDVADIHATGEVATASAASALASQEASASASASAAASAAAAQAAQAGAVAAQGVAEGSAANAATNAAAASASAASSDASAASANAAASGASTSAAAADVAAATATTKAAEAAVSAFAASASATAAGASEAASLASQDASADSATSASASASAAATSEVNAAASATSAASSATSASGSAASAGASRDAAATSATNAANSASAASTSATNAGDSATAAAASASNAAATLANAVTKTTIDAKGDLLAGTANDSLARLAVGPNGSLLMADSNAAGGLSYQSPMPLLVNLLTNSDFSNGTTGWDSSNAGATIASVGNTIVLTITDAAVGSQAICATIPETTAGRVYYMACTITPIVAHAPLMRVGNTNMLSTITAPAGVASRTSMLITASGASTLAFFYSNGAFTTGQANGLTVTFDNAVCIDLTACFGAGKEPSLAEMDAIMARYPNSWFAKETPQLLPTYDWLKLTQNAATNLVQNGDFSNGTTGWGASNCTLTATASTLSITASGAAKLGTAAQLPAGFKRYGQKVYARMRARVTNSSCLNLAMQVGAVSFAQASPVANTWYDISAVAAEPNDGVDLYTNPYHEYADAATASGNVMEVQYVLIIDLTKTFGAGNEPTKSEMDYLLSKYPNSWFNGTVNDLVTRYDSRRRIGTGSPEGVVTAPVGTEWTDIAATNGAIKWVKSVGPGSTGWTVTVGDTGWRDISSLAVNSWTGTMRLRRSGSICSLYLDFVRGGTDVTVLTLPGGFRPPDYTKTSVLAGGTLQSIYLSTAGVLTRQDIAHTGPTGGGEIWSWPSNDPWPTTLPGIPA